MPDWKSPATLERLIAALVAANNNKVDNQAIARYMDETYDAVENRMRVYKREATKLSKEAEQAGRLDMDMRKRKDGNASPKKSRVSPKKGELHGVVSGRVSKTPTKKKTLSMKQESISSDSSAFNDLPISAPSFSFDNIEFDQNSFNDNNNTMEDWQNGLA